MTSQPLNAIISISKGKVKVIKMITVYAENIKTGEVLELGEFPTMEEAQWNIDNNIEFDEEDNPADWKFFTMAEISSDEEFDKYLEHGFDPYSGCYTYDC